MRRQSVLLALLITFVVLATIVGTGVVAWRVARRAIATEILAPKEKTVDIATIVTRVRELSRLETAAMHIVHIGTITQSYTMVPSSLAGDEITFLAAGDVIAGIDLSRLRQEDIWREPGGTVVLRLPPAQILVTRVDNRESRVLRRTTGMLRRADVDLETRARQHAETNIRVEALKKGILPMAAASSQQKLAGFLHTMGFEKVRFVTSGVAAPVAR